MVLTIILSYCFVRRWDSAGQFLLGVPFMSFPSDGGWSWIIWRLDWAGYPRGYTHISGSWFWLLVWVHLSTRAPTCGLSMWLALLTERQLRHNQCSFTVAQGSEKASWRLLVLLKASLRTNTAAFPPCLSIKQVKGEYIFWWRRIRLLLSVGEGANQSK